MVLTFDRDLDAIVGICDGFFFLFFSRSVCFPAKSRFSDFNRIVFFFDLDTKFLLHFVDGSGAGCSDPV